MSSLTLSWEAVLTVGRTHTTMVHLAFWFTVEFSEGWESLPSRAVGETYPIPSLEYLL